ncbi:MAG: thiol reductant ABC exporter subunit CydD [Calditrichaeota bacterium]|nr:thiol reductant ABC exporter subunit CydD [Calditrichota bacterium]
MNFDKRLLKQLKSVSIPLGFTVFLSLMTSAAIVGQAKFLSRIINRAFLEKQTLESVWSLLLVFAVLSIFRAVFHWGSQSAAAQIAARIKSSLRKKLGTHLVRLGPAYAKTRQSGEINNTLIAGIDALDAYFSQYLPQVMLSVLIPVLILVFVFPIDLLSGIVFLLTAPLIPIFMILIGEMAQAMTRKQWKTLNRMSAHFLDVLQGLTTLKLLGRSKEQIHHIERITNDFRGSTMKVLHVAFLSALSLELLSTISTAIIAVEIGLRLLYAKMGFENALFILILAPEFYLPLRRLGTRFHAGMEGFSAAQSIFKILEEPAKIPGRYERGRVDFRGVIQFKNVFFSYPDTQHPALNGVSFEIKPKQITALVGASGAGKTTITYLLLQFIYAQQGGIYAGGKSITNFSPNEWRTLISWVPQNPYIFHTSVAENIKLAKPTASEDEIIEAAELANIHEFIQQLPGGYETIVGERAARLSGGQAQRLALARAFLKNSEFIILDEPTSSLDPQVERQIYKSIQQLVENKTVLLIAHRLSTVKKADQIVIIDDGKIVETGTHTELLDKKGAYSKMVFASGGRNG